MKKIKIISGINFTLLYIYASLLISIIIFASINVEKSSNSTNIIQILLFACLGIIVTIIILGIINFLNCLKLSDELIDSSFLKTTFKMKIGLIPFFIINFIFWAILWIGTLNVFLILIAPIIWVISLFTTYIFLLINGTYNIVYLLKKFFKSKKIIYLVYGILHFIYFADIIGAFLAYQYDNNLV